MSPKHVRKMPQTEATAYTPANCSRHCCRSQTVTGRQQIDVVLTRVEKCPKQQPWPHSFMVAVQLASPPTGCHAFGHTPASSTTLGDCSCKRHKFCSWTLLRQAMSQSRSASSPYLPHLVIPGCPVNLIRYRSIKCSPDRITAPFALSASSLLRLARSAAPTAGSALPHCPVFYLSLAALGTTRTFSEDRPIAS